MGVGSARGGRLACTEDIQVGSNPTISTNFKVLYLKNILYILCLFMTNILHADQLSVDYWNGLAYDFSNANAYEIKHKAANGFEVGVIAKTSQLYWDCVGCYSVIPQNFALKVGKTYEFDKFQIDVSNNFWNTKSVIFPNKYNYELGIQYSFNEHNFIKARHYSNSNSIHDLYTISVEYSF
jgi:hypothetical protein